MRPLTLAQLLLEQPPAPLCVRGVFVLYRWQKPSSVITRPRQLVLGLKGAKLPVALAAVASSVPGGSAGTGGGGGAPGGKGGGAGGEGPNGGLDGA